jgi:hypothetical protein
MIPSIFPPDFGQPPRGDVPQQPPPRTGLRVARALLMADWHAYSSAPARVLDWWPDPMTLPADVYLPGAVLDNAAKEIW